MNDKILTTIHPSEHTRKQSARHLACLNWVEAYLQNALVSPEQRVKPEPPEQKVDLKQQTTTVIAPTQQVEVSGSRAIRSGGSFTKARASDFVEDVEGWTTVRQLSIRGHSGIALAESRV